MFIPIKDDQPTFLTPHVTIGLIFVNTIVFLYSQTLGFQGFNQFITYYGFTPLIYLNSESSYILPSWYVLTPLSSMFLHGGWMHLIGNMLFLWIFGNNVEDYFGHIKFLIFYIISGLAAVALFTLFNMSGNAPLVGASGAVAGVMGAYLVLHPRAKITVLIVLVFIMFQQFSAKSVLLIWFGYQILMSLVGSSTGGGVAWMAHVGGFLFGWLLLRAWFKIRGDNRGYRITWR